MSKSKKAPTERAVISKANEVLGAAYEGVYKDFVGENITNVEAKKMYEEQFKELITLLAPMPDADKERLIKATIKFYGLDHVLRSECSY